MLFPTPHHFPHSSLSSFSSIFLTKFSLRQTSKSLLWFDILKSKVVVADVQCYGCILHEPLSAYAVGRMSPRSDSFSRRKAAKIMAFVIRKREILYLTGFKKLLSIHLGAKVYEAFSLDHYCENLSVVFVRTEDSSLMLPTRVHHFYFPPPFCSPLFFRLCFFFLLGG